MGRRTWLGAIAVLALAVPAPAQARSHFKPCVRQGQPVPFATYWLGPSFEGMPLRSRSYTCTDAATGERTNDMTFAYGSCESAGEVACDLPLKVTTEPACEENLSFYERGGQFFLPARPLRLRGVPGIQSLVSGFHLILYTGDVTVHLFGTSEAQVYAAADALRRMPDARARPSASALPPPVPGHLSGRLDCGLRFTRTTVRVGGAPDGFGYVTLVAQLPRPGLAFRSERFLDPPDPENPWQADFTTIGGGRTLRRRFVERISLPAGRWEIAFRAVDRRGHSALRTLRIVVPPPS